MRKTLAIATAATLLAACAPHHPPSVASIYCDDLASHSTEPTWAPGSDAISGAANILNFVNMTVGRAVLYRRCMRESHGTQP